MIKIRALKTDKYADKEPSKPVLFLMKGKTCMVPEHMADRIIELGGAELVPSSEETQSQPNDFDKKVIDVEPKEPSSEPSRRNTKRRRS